MSSTVQPVEQSLAKPEVLPWRTRLKNHRQTARLCQYQEESGVRKYPDEEAATSTSDSSQLQSPSSMIQAQPENLHDGMKLPAAANSDELQVPNATLSLPESMRSDVVVD